MTEKRVYVWHYFCDTDQFLYTVDHCFSVLKRVKTQLRCTMGQKKLEGLLLLSVERKTMLTLTQNQERFICTSLVPRPKIRTYLTVCDIANMLLGLGTRLFILSPLSFKCVIVVYGSDIGQSVQRWTCTRSRRSIHAYMYIYFC